MASGSQVEEFRRANNDVVTLARRDLARFWNALDLSDGVAVRRALEGFFPELVAEYGLATASLAADWFEDVRESSRARGSFSAVTAETVAAEQANARMRWGISPLFGGDQAQSLSNLLLIADEYVKQPGRDTIAISSERDPAGARWARVPAGAETCAFCRLLASRGGVYATRSTASATTSGRSYHGDCDCVPTPIWDETDYPAGYDPDALYAEYGRARKAADSDDPRAILAALRKQEGTH